MQVCYANGIALQQGDLGMDTHPLSIELLHKEESEAILKFFIGSVAQTVCEEGIHSPKLQLKSELDTIALTGKSTNPTNSQSSPTISPIVASD